MIHRAAAKSHDRKIIGNADDLLTFHPHGVVAALSVTPLLDSAVERDLVTFQGSLDQPRRRVGAPGIRFLTLASTDDLLPEKTVVVANATTEARKIKARHRIDEARGQSTQSAVAERRVVF